MATKPKTKSEFVIFKKMDGFKFPGYFWDDGFTTEKKAVDALRKDYGDSKYFRVVKVTYEEIASGVKNDKDD